MIPTQTEKDLLGELCHNTDRIARALEHLANQLPVDESIMLGLITRMANKEAP